MTTSVAASRAGRTWETCRRSCLDSRCKPRNAAESQESCAFPHRSARGRPESGENSLAVEPRRLHPWGICAPRRRGRTLRGPCHFSPDDHSTGPPPRPVDAQHPDNDQSEPFVERQRQPATPSSWAVPHFGVNDIWLLLMPGSQWAVIAALQVAFRLTTVSVRTPVNVLPDDGDRWAGVRSTASTRIGCHRAERLCLHEFSAHPGDRRCRSVEFVQGANLASSLWIS